MRSLNELLNSGKTLSKKETEVVERYIEANSTRISLEELNYLKCKAAIHERWKKWGQYNWDLKGWFYKIDVLKALFFISYPITSLSLNKAL